ncbi:MAG: soluble lytic murein transglycosylase [Candidatus Atribacteria bacterium]|nr:soluble lytic murein transglycosylase [Candidatus Atribacteria bacterium]
MKKKYFFFVIIVSLFYTFVFGFSSVSSGEENKLNLDQLIDFFVAGEYQEVLDNLSRSQLAVGVLPQEGVFLQIASLLSLGEIDQAAETLKSILDKSYLFTDHLISLLVSDLVQSEQITRAQIWVQLLQDLYSQSPVTFPSTVEVARALTLENPRESLSLITSSLYLAQTEEQRLQAAIIIVANLRETGHFAEAFFFLRHLFYTYPTLSSSETREEASPLLAELEPAGWSPATQLASAEFLIKLGWSETALSILNQLNFSLLSASAKEQFFLLLIQIYLSSGNLDQLSSVLTQMERTLGETDSFLFYSGVLKQRQAYYTQAISIYRYLLSVFPDTPYQYSTYLNLKTCYWVTDIDGYQAILNEMISLFPNRPQFVWELFWFYLQKEQTSSAYEALDLLLSFPERKNQALFWQYKLSNIPSLDPLLSIVQGSYIDYYFVRAWQELEQQGISLSADFLFSPMTEELSLPTHSSHWEKYLFLKKLELWNNAEKELTYLRRIYPQYSAIHWELSDFYREKKDFRKSILHGIYYQQQLPGTAAPRQVWEKVYPDFFLTYIETLCEPFEIDPYLILSLVRAESFFDVQAVSPAGAVGLAQLMPSTAAWMIEIKMVDIPHTEGDYSYLFQPENSLSLGISYLAYLLDLFEGKIYPAICAYNAGPGRVQQWLKENPQDPDYFFEAIPFSETHNYLEKVLVNYFHYSLIYQNHFEPKNLL